MVPKAGLEPALCDIIYNNFNTLKMADTPLINIAGVGRGLKMDITGI